MSTVDLSPALKELTELYSRLLQKVRTENNNVRGNYPKQLSQLRDTVVAIAPKDRRIEDGWFRPAKWESHTNKALAIMASEVEKPIDEIFIAGEALNGDAIEITKLMLHQLVHQLTNVIWVDTKMTYHSPSFAAVYNALGFEVAREKKGGWTNVDYTADRTGFASSMMEVAAQIDMTAFDAFRKNVPQTQSIEGRMRKWQCDCKRPVLYTGGVLCAVCDICHTPFMYMHKDRTSQAVRAWLIGKGLPANRIGS